MQHQQIKTHGAKTRANEKSTAGINSSSRQARPTQILRNYICMQSLRLCAHLSFKIDIHATHMKGKWKTNNSKTLSHSNPTNQSIYFTTPQRKPTTSILKSETHNVEIYQNSHFDPTKKKITDQEKQ